MLEHAFTATIREILRGEFGGGGDIVFDNSALLQYLNHKTRSVSKGSKSRGSFANQYAVYVLVEDYIYHGYMESGDYATYEGARFSELFRRQRELPFGSKLQNHALNHRMNEEFRKYFPTCEYQPILRDAETNRYWINQKLLTIETNGMTVNIAPTIIKVIDAYINAKREAFEGFIQTCQKMQSLEKDDPKAMRDFISDQLKPNVDARLFEIVSFAILKVHYSREVIYWGWTRDSINKECLALFKTGRCNANDGGIDFVMRPLGRFFQVTETTDVRKYFLDIDKVQRYPITFVVKSNESADRLSGQIKQRAERVYCVKKVVERYMECVEEIINIPILHKHLDKLANESRLRPVIDEVVFQSKVEFNYQEETA